MISRWQFKKELGFTLIELLLVLSLISIVSVVSISIVGSSLDEARFNQTTSQMQQIRTAIIGDLELREGNTRSSFGYLGDMGSIPSNSIGLAGLTSKPGAAPNWSVNTNVRFGMGWNGPYISSSFSGNPLQDAWGNNFLYNANSNPPTITSLGADGANNGTGYNQDIVVTLPSELRAANVYGFISDGGGPYLSTASVDLNYPNGSGALQVSTTNLTAADKGYFQFSNIPLGKRSLTVYVPNKTTPTKTIGPIQISVDQGNYLVPTNLVDVNPGGGSGGGGGGGGGSSCATPSGEANYVSGSGYKGFTTINFTVRFNSSVVINSLSQTTNTASNMDRIRIGGSSYRCGGGSRSMSPCPVMNGQTGAISPTYNSGKNNVSFIARFTTPISGEHNLRLIIVHDKGCDTITVNDI